MDTAKPQIIAQMNKVAIVRKVKQYGTLSRADLSRMLNMSFPSVSLNTKQLIEANYIEELGGAAGKDGLGRRSTVLGFNKTRGFIVGVYFNINSVIAAGADLLGNTYAIIEKQVDITGDGECVYGLIREAIEEALEKSNIPLEKLESLCIGVPGVFDEKTGKNKLVPYLNQWEDIHISERLRKDYIDNVIVENVVNLGVIGEKWKGNAKDYDNVVYLDYHIGISTGLLLNGELFRGASGMAGEVGYMVLDNKQIPKTFTTEGALEEILSGVALSKKVENITGKPDERFIIASLIELRDRGEVQAAKMLDTVVDNISAMIVNTVSVLNPDLVILSGANGMQLGKFYLEHIKSIVSRHVPYMPEMRISKYTGSQAGLHGALYMAMAHARSNIDYEHFDLHRRFGEKRPGSLPTS